jgi:hypothetical protein
MLPSSESGHATGFQIPILSEEKLKLIGLRPAGYDSRVRLQGPFLSSALQAGDGMLAELPWARDALVKHLHHTPTVSAYADDRRSLIGKDSHGNRWRNVANDAQHLHTILFVLNRKPKWAQLGRLGDLVQSRF